MDKEGFVLDLDGLFFEDLLAQAVQSPTDEAAQFALQGYVQEVVRSGDLERSMALSMMLGATACLHPHLESTANSLASMLSEWRPHDDSPHEHALDDGNDDSEETVSTSSKRSAKKRAFVRQDVRFADIILKYFHKGSSDRVKYRGRNIDPTRQKSV